MKLPNTNATHLKIPLSQIRETGNVRQEYDAAGIAELAESIKNNGLLNPLTVKPGQDDENGNKTYELIAGHRRLRAYQLLCENGDDFSMVECCVRPGKKIVLQMIENIQRQDITPREKEEAVKAMLAEGYTQSDIARELSKPIAWVSDIVAGTKVREVADKNGVDTDGIATKTLSQLRSIPAKDLPAKIKELSDRGGTFREATEIMNEAKGRPRVPITPLPDTLEEFQAEMTQKRAATTNVSNDDDIEAPDIVEEKPKKKKAEKKPRRFNIYVKPNNRLDMMSALGQLKVYIQDLELGTKICVQAGNDIADVSSIIYEPENNRVVFRSLDSVFNGGKK